MIPISMERPPRRASLQAFSLVFGALVGAAIAGSTLLGAGPGALVLAASVTLAAWLVGVLRPAAMVPPYRVWNRLASLYASGARFCILAVSYFLVVATVGRLGSKLVLSRSVWATRPTLSASTYSSQHRLPSSTSASGWVRNYLSWALRSDNTWTVALLPFLLLAESLEAPEQRELPDEIYTLY